MRPAHRSVPSRMSAVAAPTLSVVIPVYNEEAVLQALFDRLYPALDALGCTYEIVFVNDGSLDKSRRSCASSSKAPRRDARGPLNGNYGQHMAIMAGFEYCRGQRVVTLDADCRTPRRRSRSFSRRWTRATTTWAPSA